jgi:hypothetical protein
MFKSNDAQKLGAQRTRQIKEWVRELLAPDEATTIVVSELTCREPGCPPVETVIALLQSGKPGEKHTIHRAAAEITREDVAALRSPDHDGGP